MPPRDLAAVEGRRLEWSLAEFEARTCHHIGNLQRLPNPDNGLIAILCNAVRLAREYADSARDPIGKGPILFALHGLRVSEVGSMLEPRGSDDARPVTRIVLNDVHDSVEMTRKSSQNTGSLQVGDFVTLELKANE